MCSSDSYKIWSCVCVLFVTAWTFLRAYERKYEPLFVSLRPEEWCTANLRAISHLSQRGECLVGREPQDGWAACCFSVIDFTGLLALLSQATNKLIITSLCKAWKQRGRGRIVSRPNTRRFLCVLTLACVLNLTPCKMLNFHVSWGC